MAGDGGICGERVPFVLAPDEPVFDHDPRVTRALMDRLRADGREVVTDASGGVMWLLSADDADEMLAQPQLRAEMAMEVLHASDVKDGPLHELWSEQMFGKDGDEHRRLRQSVARRLTPRAVAEMRPAVERISAELLSSWAPGTVVDAWSAFAVPLPARAACLLLGVPQEDASRIAAWALQLVRAFGILEAGAVERVEVAAAGLAAYLDEHLAAGAAPVGSILHALSQEGGGDMSAEESKAIAANLVFGGLDATAKAISTGLALLLSNPDAWSRLTADPERCAPAAVAEVLRFSPPVAGVARLVVEPTTCRGVDLRGSQIVISSLDAVCRDARHFDHPDEFDVTREGAKQYAFGLGPHYCLGANLAKMVVEVALRDIAATLPGLRLETPIKYLRWAQNPVRGVVVVPVLVPDDGTRPS